MRTAAIIIGILTVSYWMIFFGEALVATLQLYQNGNSIYNVLNTTNKIPVDTNQTKVPLLMHRMSKDDHILAKENNHDLPVNWTRAFNYCHKVYQQRNWSTILWTDQTIRIFIEKEYLNFLPIYDSYPYKIQRVDAARYFILYHYGGLYMDLDIGCKSSKDLTDLVHTMVRLGKVAMIPQTKPFGFSNDVMFATNASPFFGEVINALSSQNKWYGSPYLTVMYSTGPMFLSRVYAGLSAEHQNDVLILPPELYSEKKTRYFKHLRGSTWHDKDARIIQWLIRKWSLFSVALFLPLLLYAMHTKRRPQKHECKVV